MLKIVERQNFNWCSRIDQNILRLVKIESENTCTEQRVRLSVFLHSNSDKIVFFWFGFRENLNEGTNFHA